MRPKMPAFTNEFAHSIPQVGSSCLASTPLAKVAGRARTSDPDSLARTDVIVAATLSTSEPTSLPPGLRLVGRHSGIPPSLLRPISPQLSPYLTRSLPQRDARRSGGERWRGRLPRRPPRSLHQEGSDCDPQCCETRL